MPKSRKQTLVSAGKANPSLSPIYEGNTPRSNALPSIGRILQETRVPSAYHSNAADFTYKSAKPKSRVRVLPSIAPRTLAHHQPIDMNVTNRVVSRVASRLPSITTATAKRIPSTAFLPSHPMTKLMLAPPPPSISLMAKGGKKSSKKKSTKK